jgi:hypothetical protein
MGRGPTLTKDSCDNWTDKDAYVGLQLILVGCIRKVH